MARTKGTRSSSKNRQAPRPAKAAAHDSGDLLGSRKLQQLYTAMLQCRLIAEEAHRLSSGGKSAGNHSAGGQEATEVGAIMGLGPLDCLAPRRRNLVAGFIVGVPLAELLTQLCATKPVSADLLRDPDANPRRPLIIAGTAAMAARINISTGVALAYKTQKKPGVVVAFSGDDSTALVSWREAMDFAITHRLPIVHVVQDDLGSGSPDGTQPAAGTNTGESSIPTLVVDGNDVVAVYRVAHEAIRRARQGYGPTLIECKTHCWPGYSGIAPAQNPPLVQGQSGGALNDPIAAMEVYLAQKGLWSEAWKQSLVNTFRKRLDAAIVAAQTEKETTTKGPKEPGRK